MIYDRNGIAIVDNQPTYDLKFIPEYITSDFNYELLSKLANMENKLANVTRSILKNTSNTSNTSNISKP